MNGVDPDDAREAFKQIVVDGLRTLKAKRNMVQADVASALGVKQSTVSAWKVGKSIPEISTVRPLAELFDVSPRKLTDLVVAASAARRPQRTPPSVDGEVSQLRADLARLAEAVARLEAIVLPLVESSQSKGTPGP